MDFRKKVLDQLKWIEAELLKAEGTDKLALKSAEHELINLIWAELDWKHNSSEAGVVQ